MSDVTRIRDDETCIRILYSPLDLELEWYSYCTVRHFMEVNAHERRICTMQAPDCFVFLFGSLPGIVSSYSTMINATIVQ
eukprot:COSAG02_NODE_211_length_28730_cov_5.599490_26_plen_80_part_00